MDPELKRSIDELKVLTKDNHRMLRAIRRDQWFGFIGKVIFWAALIIVPYYFYLQYVQPMVTKLAPTAQTSASTTAFPQLQNLINLVQAGA